MKCQSSGVFVILGKEKNTMGGLSREENETKIE